MSEVICLRFCFSQWEKGQVKKIASLSACSWVVDCYTTNQEWFSLYFFTLFLQNETQFLICMVCLVPFSFLLKLWIYELEAVVYLGRIEKCSDW